MPLFTHILTLATVALVALSSFPDRANALAAHPQAARHIRGHDAVAKRRRDASLPSTCIPRPSTALSSSSPTPTPTPTPTPSTTVSSTTTPSPSATSSGSSQKKLGLAWGDDDTYLPNFARPRVGYFQNWSPQMPTAQLQQLGIQPIPLLWNDSPENVAEFQQVVVEGYATIAGAINEPDQIGQADMTPGAAASLFVNVMKPLKNLGYTIHGPCCTDSPDAQTWYLEFEGNCTALGGCGLDWSCVHAYNTNVTYITEYFTWMYSTFGRPLIVTEVGDQDFSGANIQAANLGQVMAFAETLVEFTNNNDWMVAIFPYAIEENLNIYYLNALIDTSTHYPTSLGYEYFG